MIIKMILLRLLGSSDDKEKIGVARPEGPPLRCIRWLSDDPMAWLLMQVCEAPVEPTDPRKASVHWAYYVLETM